MSKHVKDALREISVQLGTIDREKKRRVDLLPANTS
jgi:hypothetical protein